MLRKYYTTNQKLLMIWNKSLPLDLTLFIFGTIILHTQTFVLPTYCTILHVLYSLQHVSTLNLCHPQGATYLFDLQYRVLINGNHRVFLSHDLRAYFVWRQCLIFRRLDTACCTRVVPKVRVLIFYLNVCCTHLKLQVICFKVWPLGSCTVVPSFFPLPIAVPEVIFRKCV